MSNISDPFSDLVLDEEEQLLETALEQGDFEEVSDLEGAKKDARRSCQPLSSINTYTTD